MGGALIRKEARIKIVNLHVLKIRPANDLCKQFGSKQPNTLMVFQNEFFEKVKFKNNQQNTKKACKTFLQAKSSDKERQIEEGLIS